MREIVLATGNIGKQREFVELLEDLPIHILSLNDFPHVGEVEETGETFAENAELKAVTYAKETGKLCLADDSGLEVEALGNAPGVFSARYAGENASNEERISKLLTELKAVKDAERRAGFVCVIVLASEKGEILYRAKGICPGKIGFEPRGEKGFGYDPIFIPTGFDETFGELSSEIKHQISHRARATKQIKGFLCGFIDFQT